MFKKLQLTYKTKTSLSKAVNLLKDTYAIVPDTRFYLGKEPLTLVMETPELCISSEEVDFIVEQTAAAGVITSLAS